MWQTRFFLRPFSLHLTTCRCSRLSLSSLHCRGFAARSNDTYYTRIVEFKRTQRLDTLSAENPDRIAVEKLQEYCEEFLEEYNDEPSEWQRKTGKVVLAMLVCHNPDPNSDEYLSFRGMNFELSQTTGSRCAEQCAIGAAVASFVPKRSMRSIAVVDPMGPKNPLAPCGVCTEMLQKIQKESPDFRLIEFPDFENDRFDSIRSWFPGRLTTIADPKAAPEELQIWECHFCGFDENTPHATRCLNCKQATRSLATDGIGKNRRIVLKALLEMATVCPSSRCEFLAFDIPAYQIKGAITQSNFHKGTMKSIAKLLAKEVSQRLAKAGVMKKQRRQRERELLAGADSPSALVMKLLPEVGEKTRQLAEQKLKLDILGFIKGLEHQGLDGVFKQIEVGAPGQERMEYCFTDLGKRYVQSL